MPDLTAVPHLRLIPKNDDLLTLPLPEGICYHLCPFDNRRTYGYLLPIGDKQHPLQLDGVALPNRKTLYLNGLPRGDLILLSPRFDNSVNLFLPK